MELLQSLSNGEKQIASGTQTGLAVIEGQNVEAVYLCQSKATSTKKRMEENIRQNVSQKCEAYGVPWALFPFWRSEIKFHLGRLRGICDGSCQEAAEELHVVEVAEMEDEKRQLESEI